MYETVGKLKLIYDTQTFASGFMKREFVVTTQDKFPQDLKFEIVKDKCSLLDDFAPDQEVQVNFDIRGNEYNGKYYVNLSCWKIQPADGQPSENRPAAAGKPRQAGPSSSSGPRNSAPASSSNEPSSADLRKDDDFDDDIPF